MKELLYSTLKEYWWYDSFRPNQEEATTSLVNWRNIVYVSRTWDWKSLVFQLAWVLQKNKTAIIVSPLKSLMVDQVNNLLKKNISATYINSDLEPSEKVKRIHNLRNWEYQFVYIAPERLVMDNFLEILDEVDISYFIIDEFDTISEYGSSWFREEFLALGDIYKRLQESHSSHIPVGLFTATATPSDLELVYELLDLNEDTTDRFQGELTSPNMTLRVFSEENLTNAKDRLWRQVNEWLSVLRDLWWAMIIFCTTTKDVDSVYDDLKLVYKDRVGKYHAWMAELRKNSSFKKFMEWKIDIMVCTCAFWRWVDKSDIRYIIHYWLPGNISAYLQEVGRWGRDGQRWFWSLIFWPTHVNTRRFMAKSSSYEAIISFDKVLSLFADYEDWKLLADMKSWHSLYEWIYDEFEIPYSKEKNKGIQDWYNYLIELEKREKERLRKEYEEASVKRRKELEKQRDEEYKLIGEAKKKKAEAKKTAAKKKRQTTKDKVTPKRKTVSRRKVTKRTTK